MPDVQTTSMLKWRDVSYELNGYKCSVIFDWSEHPYEFKRYDGIIRVMDVSAMPFLRNPVTDHLMVPPGYATVLIHTPEVKEDMW